MFEKAKRVRDAFTFSLGGMTTIASFVAAPAIADDRINKIRDAHQSMLQARRAEAACEEAEGPSQGGMEPCTQSA